jgi:hypothetical protein
MLRILRFCRDDSGNVQNVQTFRTMFRLCSDNVQTMLTLFRQCSQNVQTLFKQYSECSESVQNFQKMFRIFRQCSESVQTFSEILAQKLDYSEFHDFVVIHSHLLWGHHQHKMPRCSWNIAKVILWRLLT